MAKRTTTPSKPAKRKPPAKPAIKGKPATRPAPGKPSPTRAKRRSRAKPTPRPAARAAAPPKKPPSKPPAPPAASPPPGDDAYGRRKEAARARNAEIAETGRDIGAIPEVADPARRAACEKDLERYLSTYFPKTFYLPFCADQRRAIAKAESAVMGGDLFALAMPRGMGKTVICEGAALWGLSYGHVLFALLLGATGGLALKSLDAIKASLETNELLLADFPEICRPIAALEGISNRCKGQLCEGRPTRIVWTNRRLVLPTIAGSAASGAALHCCGILAGVRGLSHKTADGRSVRPDLFLGDDLQTDASAKSPTQVEKRLRVLMHTVLGLAGPDKSIAGLVPCTVIETGDLADQLLERGEHPEFSGERCKLLYAMPANMTLWARYAEIREEGLAADSASRLHTEFYAANRESMDEGAQPAWPERFIPAKGQISAVQYAMDLFFDDEARFAAEYQNQPLLPQADEDELTVEQVLSRANGMARGIVPVWATRLTAFIDVQRHLHWYVVCAWADDFTGQIIDYGTCPKQTRTYFASREASPTLESLARCAGMEAQIRAGLDRLADQLLGAEWRREGLGEAVRIRRCLVDANWGESTDVVYEFCRRSKHAALLNASHGQGIGSSSRPLNAGRTKAKQGEMIGLNWYSPIPTKRATRHFMFDANAWKSFVTARLQVPAGGKGRMEIFGRAADHKLFADHLTAERGERNTNEKTGRSVVEYRLRSLGRDNHWLDGIVGCSVAAAIEGAKLAALPGAAPTPKRKRVDFGEAQREAFRRQGQGAGRA